MTGKQRMLATLRFEQPDRPPHFESMFELEYEAFGLRFPDRNSWTSCTPSQKSTQIDTCMEIYQRVVTEFQWDALAVYWPWSDADGVAAAKRIFGDSILIGGMVSSSLWCIDTIHDWDQFAVDFMENPKELHIRARAMCDAGLAQIDRLMDAGADFIYLPHDVADNRGSFISPVDFARLVTPYWAELVDRVKQRGGYAFLHSDGNLTPVLDQLISLNAHALQSIDPMAGMDIAQVKERTFGKLALMGNVQCNLMQDGTDEAIEKSARYCLKHGTPGGGYIFSTSNTIFPGMPLRNYRHMLQVFQDFNAGRLTVPRERAAAELSSKHQNTDQIKGVISQNI